MNIFIKAVAVIATAGMATVANASVVHGTLDFAGHGGLATSHTISDSNVSVTATGHLLNSDGSLGSQEKIGQYKSSGWGTGGLGVTNDNEWKKKCSGWGWHYSCKWVSTDSHQIDNHKNDEAVKLAFDKEVSITKVYFSYVNSYDDFSFSIFDEWGGVTNFAGRLDIDQSGYGGSFTFAPGALTASTMFAFGAFKDNSHDVDGFKLRGVKYSYNVPAVPLPAGAALLLTALGGLGAARRLKKAA